MIDRIFKYYVTVALLVITGILIFVFFRISPQNQATKSDENKIESLYFQNNEINGLINNNLKISDDIILLQSDGNIRDIKLSELPPTLVFRFSEISCSHCVDYVLDKIKQYFKDYEINPNILTIVSDSRQSTTQKKRNMLYLQSPNTLGLPVEKSYIPFLFLLDKGQVTHFFFPESAFDKYTDIYFKSLKKRYFPPDADKD
jgi:sulfur relay (sulfurtransferase) DsrC/TusE family protein